MGRIILPNVLDADLKDEVSDGEELTRRQRKKLERQMEQERRALLKPAQMVHVVSLANGIQKLANMLTENDIVLAALFEVMEEKGLLTKEELVEKQKAIVDKIRETPNSPAAEEARESAEDPSQVGRLDEILPAVEEEELPNRLVEG